MSSKPYKTVTKQQMQTLHPHNESYSAWGNKWKHIRRGQRSKKRKKKRGGEN